MKSPTLILIVKLLAAIIMLQTLFFKFTAAHESVALFTQLGMEPEGRIGIGIAELVASILLFIPGNLWLGAGMGCGLMSGAIFFHITKLGIQMNDGGKLFAMACITLVCCLILLWSDRRSVPFIGKYFEPKA